MKKDFIRSLFEYSSPSGLEPSINFYLAFPSEEQLKIAAYRFRASSRFDSF